MHANIPIKLTTQTLLLTSYFPPSHTHTILLYLSATEKIAVPATDAAKGAPVGIPKLPAFGVTVVDAFEVKYHRPWT